MYALNNVPTTDDYTDDTTLNCPNVTAISVQVLNQAVYCQVAVAVEHVGATGQNWGAEGRLNPGYWNFDRDDFSPYGKATAIRVRSATPGKPAYVTILA